ncbi:unnamed protein product [Linum trigynum]|uniref:Nuclear speckle splicing regulatory protein 1 N-terminal domain-containing protein n=1 Tax=Linum trigynum TaxID=586398 RepID=A0AAV2C676_9ROSI
MGHHEMSPDKIRWSYRPRSLSEELPDSLSKITANRRRKSLPHYFSPLQFSVAAAGNSRKKVLRLRIHRQSLRRRCKQSIPYSEVAVGMSKYGLNLRVSKSQQNKRPPRPPPPKVLGFGDDEGEDVEKEILRQASKNKSLKDIEEQHKKALEEDPSAFDYDGVYDEMKQAVVRPRIEDKQQRKPKYIEALMQKAKERERQQEVVFERKIAKERSQDDHLYADKDKFVTNAYKRKLAEREQWLKEEKLRELKEQKDDVTKKSDLSDFYFNLRKNVAFGGQDAEKRRQEKRATEAKKGEEEQKQDVEESSAAGGGGGGESKATLPSLPESEKPLDPSPNPDSQTHLESTDLKPAADKPVPDASSSGPAEEVTTEGQPPAAKQATADHYKRKQDEINAARERLLARKRAKLQQQIL